MKNQITYIGSDGFILYQQVKDQTMARVTIQGKCNVKPGSRSAQLWEEYTLNFRKDGANKSIEKKRRWTLWFDNESKIRNVDLVEFKGDGSCKVTEWESPDGLKHVVEYSLNDVTIQAHTAATLRRDADGDLELAPF